MRTAFITSLCELAAQDERIWLLTGDLGFSVLEPFIEQFPDRYINVGIAEQNMVGIAAGLAHTGRIPLTYSIANFPTLRCLEQIRNDVCYHEFPVKVVSVGGGFSYGAQGYTHHGLEDLAVMRTLPGMTVVAPGDPVETRCALAAMLQQPNPGYLRLGKAGEPILHPTVPEFQLGKALQMRDGDAVTLISTGSMLASTLECADYLRDQEEISARVLSMHTIKPIDETAILAAVAETGGIVTIEEHSVTGGLGSAVGDVVLESGLHAGFFRKYGSPDRLTRCLGSQAYLREQVQGNLLHFIQQCLAPCNQRKAA